MPKISSIWWRHNDAIFKILWSNPSYPEKSDFQSISNAYISCTNGKSSKNWSGKWYGLLCFHGNFLKYFKLKLHLFCWLSTFLTFYRFLILYISRSFYRNIANHTIFQIRLSSSFHWYYLYTHLRYSEKHFFQGKKGLTIEF